VIYSGKSQIRKIKKARVSSPLVYDLIRHFANGYHRKSFFARLVILSAQIYTITAMPTTATINKVAIPIPQYSSSSLENNLSLLCLLVAFYLFISISRSDYCQELCFGVFAFTL
jgi:hypothetical protein